MTDLREFNKVIQPIDPLQSGTSLPSLYQKDDLLYLLITIPLQEKDREKNCLHSAYLKYFSACKEISMEESPTGVANGAAGYVPAGIPAPWLVYTRNNYTETVFI